LILNRQVSIEKYTDSRQALQTATTHPLKQCASRQGLSPRTYYANGKEIHFNF